MLFDAVESIEHKISESLASISCSYPLSSTTKRFNIINDGGTIVVSWFSDKYFFNYQTLNFYNSSPLNLKLTSNVSPFSVRKLISRRLSSVIESQFHVFSTFCSHSYSYSYFIIILLSSELCYCCQYVVICYNVETESEKSKSHS